MKSQHVLEHKQALKPSICLVCHKSFRSNYELGKHHTFKHDLKKLNCNHCDKTYGSKSGLDYHLVKKHNIERSITDFSINSESFICKVCGIKMSGKVASEDHNRCNHGCKKLQCHICSATFTRQSNFLRHTKTDCSLNVPGKPFLCIQCSPLKRFKLKRDAARHKKSMHSSESWSCPHCEKRFNTSWSRYYHVKKSHKK